MVRQVTFASDQMRQTFARAGFKSFDDFYLGPDTGTDGPVRRNIDVLTINDEQLYLKRFNSVHLKDIVFAALVEGRPVSQAKFEWSNARHLEKAGITSLEFVAAGSSHCCGLLRKSFNISRKLAGIPLSQYVCQSWQDLSNDQRRRLMQALGKFAAKLHHARISFPDLYLWHIYWEPQTQLCEQNFALLDLHRMSRNRRGVRYRIENLARLDHSLSPQYFDAPLRRLLLETYLADYPARTKNFAEKVLHRSAQISTRRNVKY